MTPNEFIFWLKGFTKEVNGSNITSTQWSHIQHMLETIDSDTKWKPEHGNNSPKFNPPYTTGGDDEFVINKK